MDKFKFKELLMNIAVCAMSCDGDIDEKEINALKKIEKETPYFSEIDLSKKLENALKKCNKDIESFKKNIFNKIKNNKLNIVQELTILEISLRIIAADEIELEVEKEFIKSIRTYLKISDFLISERFGEIDYLKPNPINLSNQKGFDSAIELKKINKLKND